MKIPLLATGTRGLVGSRAVEILGEKIEFEALNRQDGVDITDYEAVEAVVQESQAKTILHMAAKTDVDSCEDDKILGEEGEAWIVNVLGTENIVSAANKFNKRIIFISTDFVFDGDPKKDYYTEEDSPNPVNWYGETKYQAEVRVENSDVPHAILRLSYPYRAQYDHKLDFVRKLIERMSKKETIRGVTDHIFTPTFIDDFVLALELIIERELNGIFHVAGSKSLPVYEAVKNIAAEFGFKPNLVPVKRAEFFYRRAFRPFKLALNNDKIMKLGIPDLNSFEKGLKLMKEQMEL